MLNKLESFSHQGKELKTILVESSEVFPGVVCDVYNHPETGKRDLGVITIEKGIKTFPQKVIGGSQTIEGYMSGKGKLVIVKANSEKLVFDVGPGSEGFSQIVEVGDIMQWQADEDENLMVFEICYPPYEGGRFENLEYEVL